MKCLGLLICSFFLASCSAPQHTWQNQNRDVVWTAMVAAAKAPDYNAVDPRKRWIVMDNAVEVSPLLEYLHLYIRSEHLHALQLNQ